MLYHPMSQGGWSDWLVYAVTLLLALWLAYVA